MAAVRSFQSSPDSIPCQNKIIQRTIRSLFLCRFHRRALLGRQHPHRVWVDVTARLGRAVGTPTGWPGREHPYGVWAAGIFILRASPGCEHPYGVART